MWQYFNALVAAAWKGIQDSFLQPLFNLVAVLYQWISGAPSVIYVNALDAANLAGTYANGTAGVGATLTKASAGAFPTIDGVAAKQGYVYLLTAQTTAYQNGCYVLTTPGSASVAWVLTRIANPAWNASANMINGSAFYVTAGTTYGGQVWAYTGASSPTVGTTGLTFAADSLLRSAVGGAVPSIADVGTGVALPVASSYFMPITTAAAETNTLALPTFVGQRIRLMMIVRAVGDRVITTSQGINQAGNTIMTFGAARDFIELEGVTIAGGAYRWQVVANDGVALS